MSLIININGNPYKFARKSCKYFMPRFNYEMVLTSGEHEGEYVHSRVIMLFLKFIAYVDIGAIPKMIRLINRDELKAIHKFVEKYGGGGGYFIPCIKCLFQEALDDVETKYTKVVRCGEYEVKSL
jgi:nitrate/nitrite transporter NarK